MPAGGAAAVLEGVWLSRGGYWALRGVTLSLAWGEIVAVRGRSGAGKTSLARLLALLERPSRGRAVVLGVDARRAPWGPAARARLRLIGYIDQDAKMIPHLTLLENVVLPLLMAGVPWGDAVEAARPLMEELGVWELRDRPPGRVSGGERQRAAVARALAKRPRLIVADEPASHLDEENASVVYGLLSRAARAGAAVLVTTTDPAEPVPSTREYRMRQGVLEPLGGHG